MRVTLERFPTPASLVLGAILSVLAGACEKAPPSPDASEPHLVPLHAEEWYEGGNLLLRADSPGGETFLVRQLDGSERVLYDRRKDHPESRPASNKPVYRYSINCGALTRVGLAEWDTAAGEIMDCGLNRAADMEPFVWRERSKKLLYKGAVAKIRGKTALDVILSPDKSRIAVLVVEGEWTPPSAFVGGGNAEGAFFHEVLDRETGVPLGSPLRLDSEPYRSPGGGCWTPDGRFVVYTNSFSHLWIVRVPGGPLEAKP